MIQSICSLFDKRTKTYGTPFSVSHVEIAIRSFEHATQDPQSFIAAAPNDYILYLVGKFDDVTGNLHDCDVVALAQNKPE